MTNGVAIPSLQGFDCEAAVIVSGHFETNLGLSAFQQDYLPPTSSRFMRHIGVGPWLSS